MTTTYGGQPPGITGTHYGGPALGCLGSLVPPSGLDGPGYLYAGLSLPADAGKEIRGYITRLPTAGVLQVYEDSSFDYVGTADFALYQLVVDGVDSVVDIGYGPGFGRIEFTTAGAGGSSDLAGGVQAGDAVPGGAGFVGVVISALTGGVQAGDAAPGGHFTGVLSAAYSAHRSYRVPVQRRTFDTNSPGQENEGTMETYDLTDPNRPTIGKVADEKLDYPFDWTDNMSDVEDSISDFSVTVPPGLTLVSTEQVDNLVVAWLDGGFADRTYPVTCRITTAGGRRLTRTIYIAVRAQ